MNIHTKKNALNQEIFEEGLLQCSQNKELNHCKKEWKIFSKEHFNESQFCICKHLVHNITFLYNIHNRRVITIGTSCCKKYGLNLHLENGLLRTILLQNISMDLSAEGCLEGFVTDFIDDKQADLMEKIAASVDEINYFDVIDPFCRLRDDVYNLVHVFGFNLRSSLEEINNNMNIMLERIDALKTNHILKDDHAEMESNEGSVVGSFEDSVVESFQESEMESNEESTVESFQGSEMESNQESEIGSLEEFALESFQGSEMESNEEFALESFQESEIGSFEESEMESNEEPTVESFEGSEMDSNEGSAVETFQESEIGSFEESEMESNEESEMDSNEESEMESNEEFEMESLRQSEIESFKKSIEESIEEDTISGCYKSTSSENVFCENIMNMLHLSQSEDPINGFFRSLSIHIDNVTQIDTESGVESDVEFGVEPHDQKFIITKEIPIYYEIEEIITEESTTINPSKKILTILEDIDIQCLDIEIIAPAYTIMTDYSLSRSMRNIRTLVRDCRMQAQEILHICKFTSLLANGTGKK